MRSGQVQKTVRMRGGRCNPHRGTQNQRGLHRSRLVPTPQCTCRGAGPAAALWQTHEPDDTPAKGHLQHPSPLMSRGGLSQATPAGSFDAEARAASQAGMAACNRRRVLQIRRYDSRRSSSSVLGSDSTLNPLRGLLPLVSWTAPKPVPSEDGGWHRPGSSVVRTFGPFPIGPAVASAFPCVSRRPDLAVARAGILKARSVAENRLSNAK